MEHALLKANQQPGVSHSFPSASAVTVPRQSLEMALESEMPDFTKSRFPVDFTKLRIHSDDQAYASTAALGVPASLTRTTMLRSRQGESMTRTWKALSRIGCGSSPTVGCGSALTRTPNETAPAAIRAPAEFPPGEKKPKCATCQEAGRVSECCPDCAKGAGHRGNPLQASDDEHVGSGGPEPDRDEPAQCKPCSFAETIGEILKDRGSGPSEHGWTTSSETGMRPMEAGWWTSRTPTSNTIGCDGSGSLVVMQNGSTYQHGVTDCTIKHEQVHVSDWLGRYGNDICKGRAKGDLPHYNPPGKDAYATFLKKSECRAWRVGEACRKAKLAACKTNACKTYVQGHVDFATKMVKKYCGLSTGAKAAIGALGGAAAGAGIGALVGGPVGALAGAGIGAVVGGLGSLLF